MAQTAADVADFFAYTNSFIVKQQIDMIEVFTGYEQQNRYVIYDRDRNLPVFYAVEDSDCCERMMCTNNRSFCLNILAPNGTPVLRMLAPNSCTCLNQSIIVEGPPGNRIGTIDAPGSLFSCMPTFVIRDAQGIEKYRIPSDMGACCQVCPVQNFVVSDMAGTQVANIGKLFQGILMETFTSADTFGVTFTENIPLLDKALVICAVFKIDFTFYEQTHQGGGGFRVQ